LKPKKCELFQKEVEFLGRVVAPRGMHIGPGYIKDIEDWPRPKNKKELYLNQFSPHRFIGCISVQYKGISCIRQG
jgi:hypothetical protein